VSAFFIPMLTYSDLFSQYTRNIGQDGTSNSTLIADFNTALGNRYQMVLAKMHDYMTQKTVTSSTVATQQYYHYPQGLVNIEGCYVTIGQVKYPMSVVNSQYQWDWLNSLVVQPTAIPQFIFPRKVDFGIYPIPQSVYTITFNYHYRDRNMTVADYTTGSVTMTQGSQTVTGSGTAFTSAMINRMFIVTDTTNGGQGFGYRITGVTSGTELTIETGYEGDTQASLTYKIGQVPDFPEEGHIILVDGATADFYSGVRHDITTATWFNNKFFTGDGQNNSRKMGDSTITGGLIGLCNQYTDRNLEHIIDRNKKVHTFLDQNWSVNLS